MAKLELNIFTSPDDFEGHLTEGPTQEIWNQLLLFSDPPLLKKYWTPLPSDPEILFVTTSIKQAYEYFEASRSLSLKTKPLLLYYSMLNLSKAVLAITNDELPHPKHGLIKFHSNANFFNVEATNANGIFSALAKKLQAPWADNYTKTFSMGAFLANCIELFADYVNHYGGNPEIINVEINRNTSGTFSFRIEKEKVKLCPNIQTNIEAKQGFLDNFQLDSLQLPNLVYTNKFPIAGGFEGMRNEGDPVLRRYFKFGLRVGNQTTGFLYINPMPDIIPQECCYLGMLFLLGSAVRYSPNELTKWLQDPQIANTWLIEKICQLASRLYPNYMLNMLFGKTLKFAPTFQ